MCLQDLACSGLCLRSGHMGLKFGVRLMETSFDLWASLSLDAPRGSGAWTAEQESAPWGQVAFCSDLDIARSAWVQLPGSHPGGRRVGDRGNTEDWGRAITWRSRKRGSWVCLYRRD